MQQEMQVPNEPRDYHYLKWFYENADFGPGDEDVQQHLVEKYEKETGRGCPYNMMDWEEIEDLIKSGKGESTERLLRVQRAMENEQLKEDAKQRLMVAVAFYYGKDIAKEYVLGEAWKSAKAEDKKHWITLIFLCALWYSRVGDCTSLDGKTGEDEYDLIRILRQHGKLWAIKPGECYDIVKTKEGWKYKGSKRLTLKLLEDKEKWHEKIEELEDSGYIFGRFVYTTEKEAEDAQENRYW